MAIATLALFLQCEGCMQPKRLCAKDCVRNGGEDGNAMSEKLVVAQVPRHEGEQVWFPTVDLDDVFGAIHHTESCRKLLKTYGAQPRCHDETLHWPVLARGAISPSRRLGAIVCCSPSELGPELGLGAPAQGL